MKLVEISEIKNIADDEIERETLRPQMLPIKDRCRVRVGHHLTLLFENRDTVRYQVQEMMRIERLVKPASIVVDHSAYPAGRERSSAELAELANDFA